ncbi:MAG: ABC transporter ATP-binding protein [Isosphaeraceae bacterium]|nr:ABC transporter ATP-binding protein [Isosphaeraceae bacterium]
MATAAFPRARRLLKARPWPVVLAKLLAVLEALLILALFVVAGLLFSLLATRGAVLVRAAHVPQLPGWLSSHAAAPSQAGKQTDIALSDKGLYPLAYANQFPPSPWVHRVAARALLAILDRVPLLRSNLSALVVLVAVALGLLLVLTYLRQLRLALIYAAAEDAASSLRNQIHRQMYRLGQSALPTEGTGPVINLFTRSVNEVRDGLIADLDRPWRLWPLAVGLVVIALLISWKLTIFLAALGALVGLTARPLDRATRREADAATRDSAVQLALLHEDLGMIRTVRVYGMEAIDKRRFEEHLDRFAEADLRRLRSEGGWSPAIPLLIGAAIFLAVGLLGYAVLSDAPDRISLTAAVALAIALMGLWYPISDWLALRRLVRQAGRSAQGIFEFLERRPELQQAVGARFLPPLREQITFENVTLEGPARRTLLSGVSAEIRANTRNAILGLDEESKLAFVCLIPRLIDPTIGRVRIDGIDLRDVTLESLRAQVAMVLQADLIFSDSVLNNIGLGDPSFGLPRIIEAAKVAHAHHFIQELPDGYETMIGPLGHYLSPDEQYRIALARAYLHDPSIAIIEEPTTPFDEDIKHLIDDTIDRLAAGRTLIFLPHRLSTIRKCDQVIVLHNGRVESAGPPREVHGQSRLYRHIQYVEFNQFATGEIEAGQLG